MPALTEQETQALVDDGRICGVTLDTTEFHHFGYHFEAKGLAALGQFNGTDISVLFSEVVINEVQSHIRDQLVETAEKARSGINQFLKEWRSDHELAAIIAQLGLEADPIARAKELTDDFVQKIGAELVAVDNGTFQIRELHDRYFSAQAPFSKSADKKNEFPDAMALLSLQGWAQQQEGMLLAVSSDGDWARFAEESPHLVVVPKIGPALNLFNRHDGVFAARLAANLRAGTAMSLHASVESELEHFIEIFDIEAQAPYYYEAEPGESRIVGWSIKDDKPFDVLTSDEDTVTVSFIVSVEAEFHAYFTFSVHDSIDRDYVTIGGAHASQTEQFDVTIEAAVDRDEGDDPDALEVESERWSVTVDFGYVEVDYDRD
jgi:hypothetical protein